MFQIGFTLLQWGCGGGCAAPATFLPARRAAKPRAGREQPILGGAKPRQISPLEAYLKVLP